MNNKEMTELYHEQFNRIKELETENIALKRYAYHLGDCKFMMPHFGNPQPCTCGFDALLEEQE